jgi:hypothetical protein
LKLNIINARSERREHLLSELKAQNIADYELWDGANLPSVKASINAAHKQIVRYAQLAGWDEVCIAEDDIVFSNGKSLEYFLEQKPPDFDIYLSMVFLGEIYDGNRVRDWTGLTLYIVNHKFYEKLLSVPDDAHIDRELSKLGGDFLVCTPFVAKQKDGLSSNTGKFETYGQLYENRRFL